MVSSGDLQATSGRTDGGWRASRDVCRHVRLTRRGLITAVYSAVLTIPTPRGLLSLCGTCLSMDGGGRPSGTHTRGGDGRSRESGVVADTSREDETG